LEEISGVVDNNALEESGGAVFMIQIIAGLSSPFLKTMQLSISKMTKFVGV
jgi:hypothetical protein